jgi:hypothetical protein
MADIITINCLVRGESVQNAFPVDIEKSKSIGHLKDKIKDKKSVEFRDVDADRLELWKVNISGDDGAALEQLVLEDNKKLWPLWKILKVFPAEPADENIHVIVKCLPASSGKNLPLTMLLFSASVKVILINRIFVVATLAAGSSTGLLVCECLLILTQSLNHASFIFGHSLWSHLSIQILKFFNHSLPLLGFQVRLQHPQRPGLQ